MKQALAPDIAFFAPDSVAIIGATEEAGKIGSGLYKSIHADSSCTVYCVNPHYQTLFGQPCYPSVLALPAPVTHAYIAVARQRVLGVLEECAAVGIKNVVVISAGFKEADAEGAAMENEMAAFCQTHGITLLGPNTIGFINARDGFNGTFLPGAHESGTVSIISQSGGVGMAILDALRDQRCGLACWADFGNEAVVDAISLLRYFAADPATRAIGVSFEGVKNLTAFLQLAAEVNRLKPIVLLRDGKSSVGMHAALSHTGAAAQPERVMRGLFAQYGLLEAEDCRSIAVMLKALSIAKPAEGNRTVLVTNTAGPSILTVDAMEPLGVQLSAPSAALTEAVTNALGRRVPLNNPVDLSSVALDPHNYGITAETLLRSDEYDILLGFFSLNAHLLLPEDALIDAVTAAGKPAVACFLGNQADFSKYSLKPERYGIPCFYDTHDAAVAVGALTAHAKSRQITASAAVAALSPAQTDAVQAFLAARKGQRALTESDSKTLLSLCGLPVAVPKLCQTHDEALSAAEAMGYPVALKLHSLVITHKSDVGGVRLNLQNAEALSEAFDDMLPKLCSLDPDALLTVQPMLAEGFEMILGAVRMEGIGPLVMAGMGGVYAEVFRDMAFRLAPVDEREADRMLDSLTCAPILNGFRGAALHRAGVKRYLCTLSALIAQFPAIAEIDLNPCRVYQDRVAIADARIVLEG